MQFIRILLSVVVLMILFAVINNFVENNILKYILMGITFAAIYAFNQKKKA